MKILYAGIFLLVLASCHRAPGEAGELQSEVIKIHDRIMPMNSELLELKAALSKVTASLDSVKKVQPETDTTALHREADSLLHALNAADNAMSEWMYAFKTDYSEMEHQAVMDYLNEEKTKITGIEQAYEASIGGARELLDSISKDSTTKDSTSKE